MCFGKYFDAYEWIVFDQHDATVIPACQIYNADESGFTVCYKPGRVLAQKVSSSSNQPQKRQNKDVQVVTAVKTWKMYGLFDFFESKTVEVTQVKNIVWEKSATPTNMNDIIDQTMVISVKWMKEKKCGRAAGK